MHSKSNTAPQVTCSPNQVCVLRDARLNDRHFTPVPMAKEWNPEAVLAMEPKEYSGAYWFFPELHTINGIRELSKLLVELETDIYACIIRGHPRVHPSRNKRVRKNYKGKDAHFSDVRRSWILADGDRVKLPDGYDIIKDPLLCIKYALKQIYKVAPELEGVTCHVHLSGSAGIKRGISIHVWYWLEQPLDKDEFNRWMKDKNAIYGGKLFDTAPHNPVQPHYTANPIFTGVDNPIEKRSFLIEGTKDAALIVPPSEKVVERFRKTIEDYEDERLEREAQLGQGQPVREKPELKPGEDVLDFWLSRIGDEASGGDGFHMPILRACSVYVRRGDGDDEAFAKRVRAAALSADPGERSNKYIEGEAGRYNVLRTIKDCRRLFEEQLAARLASQEALLDANPLTSDIPQAKLGLAEAEQRIDEALEMSKRKDTLLNSTAGTGKTSRAASNVNSSQDFIGYFAPRHELLNELRTKITRDRRILRGREYPKTAPVDQRMCRNHEIAGIIQQSGGSVHGQFCWQCPFYKDKKTDEIVCPYLLQFKGLEEVPVVLATTSHSTIVEHIEGLEGRRFIFDEDPTNAFFGEIEIEAETIERAHEDFTDSREDDVVLNLIWLAWYALIGDGSSYNRMLNEFGDWEINEKVFEAAKERLKKRVGARIAKLPPYPGYFKADGLFARMKQIRELLHAFGQATRDGLDLSKRGDATEKGVTMATFQEPQISSGEPILIMDATARVEVLETVFRRKFEVVDASVPMPFNAKRITGLTGSKSSLLGVDARTDFDKLSKDDQAKVRERRAWLDELVIKEAAGRLTFFATTKETRSESIASVLTENIMTGHFGDMRGENRWETCDAAVLEGRNLPPVRALERRRACLPGDAVTVEEWASSVRLKDVEPHIGWHGYPMFQGDWMRHPDRVTEAMRWMACEGEAVQALGRLRTVRRGARDLTIVGEMRVPGFNDVPTYRVSDARRWGKTAPAIETYANDMLLDHGIIPLGRRDMARLRPDLFASEDAARKAVERWTPFSGLNEIQYRHVGPSRWSRLLCCSGVEVRGAVLALLGEDIEIGSNSAVRNQSGHGL